MGRRAARRGSSPLAADIQVTQLNAFRLMAELKNYSRVAEALSYSEPAVFLQLKSLERTLGLKLVHRQGRQMVLTPAGAQLIDLADGVIRNLNALCQRARALQGRIVVGAGANTATALLMPLIAQFQAANPQYQVELRIIEASDRVRQLANGSVDLALGGLGVTDLDQLRQNGLRVVAWARDDWTVYGPGALPTAATAGNVLRVYYSTRQSRWKADDCARVERRVSACLKRPALLMEADGPEVVRGAIHNGLGLGILPRSAEHASGGSLHRVCNLGTAGQLTLYLAHPRPRLLAEPAVEFLRTVLRARRTLSR